MKNLIIFLGVFIVFSCKAQQTYPLNTGLSNISPDSHVKDLNNELNPYVGTYKANFNGNEITLFITKQENRLVKRIDMNFYRDALVVNYIVKNSVGITLQDTKNIITPNIDIISTKMKSQNSVILIYSGTNCGVGWGNIYLKKINSTQISWEYIPESTIIDSSKCPAGTDINLHHLTSNFHP